MLYQHTTYTSQTSRKFFPVDSLLVTINPDIDTYLKKYLYPPSVAHVSRAHRPWGDPVFTKEGKKNGAGGNRYCLTGLTAPPRLWLCIRSFKGAAQPPTPTRPSFVPIFLSPVPSCSFPVFLPRPRTGVRSKIVKLVESLESLSQSAFNSPSRSAHLSFPYRTFHTSQPHPRSSLTPFFSFAIDICETQF